MKNILFLGGSGFIGSNLIRRFLLDSECNIFVLGRDNSSFIHLKEFEGKLVIVKSLIIDVLRIEELIIRNDVHVVVHLVSMLLPSSTIVDLQNEMLSVNMPSFKIMEICARQDILFIFISSGGAVYGNTALNRSKETDILKPISYYGYSKLQMEEMIKVLNRNCGLRYLIIRPSNPYGHGQNLKGTQGLIAVTIGKLLKNEPINIWGDGSLIRDYISIDFLCDCVYKLYVNGVINETVNVGSGIGYSIRNVMEKFTRIIGRPFIVNYTEGRNCDVNSVILNTDKLNILLPFDRDIDFDKGISAFLDEECSRHNVNL